MNYLQLIETYLPKLTHEELSQLREKIKERQMLPPDNTDEENACHLEEARKKYAAGYSKLNTIHYLKTRTGWSLSRCMAAMGFKQ